MAQVTLRDVEYDPATGAIHATREGVYDVPDDGSQGSPAEVAAMVRAERDALCSIRGRSVLVLDVSKGEQLPDVEAMVVTDGKLAPKLTA